MKSNDKGMSTPQWTNERCEQLTAMWDLWRTARRLNHSTDVVNNIRKLEELADQIDKAGFLQFLNDEAIADRFPK